MKVKIEQNGKEGKWGVDISLVRSQTPRNQTEHLFYWHIYYKDRRAGKAYINSSTEGAEFVSVFLNKPMQGRGIGGVAFRLACELSDLPAVYAEVRQSNLPSQKALRKAGFSLFGRNRSGEDILIWRRQNGSVQRKENL